MLSTITAGKNIYAETNVSEVFDKEFAIYDLNKFLGVIKLYDDNEFEFKDDYVVIYNKLNKRQYTRFYYSSPSVVVAPPAGKSVKFPEDSLAEFQLDAKEFDKLVKGTMVMSLPEIVFSGVQGEAIRISGVDSNNTAMGSFNYELSDIADEDFKLTIKVENLTKLMGGDYKVSFTERISRFYNKTKDITYYVAVEADISDDD